MLHIILIYYRGSGAGDPGPPGGKGEKGEKGDAAPLPAGPISKFYCMRKRALVAAAECWSSLITICVSIIFPEKTIASADKGETKLFLVTCISACREVGISLEVDEGDADLYARYDIHHIFLRGLLLHLKCYYKTKNRHRTLHSGPKREKIYYTT